MGQAVPFMTDPRRLTGCFLRSTKNVEETCRVLAMDNAFTAFVLSRFQQ